MDEADLRGEAESRSTSDGGQNQDSAWKDIIEVLLEEFLEFFFPKIHGSIDFSKGYTFLDKEFQKILTTSETGKRYADKLVKVYLVSGEEKWLLVHVEVQGYRETGRTATYAAGGGLPIRWCFRWSSSSLTARCMRN